MLFPLFLHTLVSNLLLLCSSNQLYWNINTKLEAENYSDPVA